MRLPFELAKNDSRERREKLGAGGLLAVMAYSASIMNEAMAFRDMVHEERENELGWKMPKIRFSWEDQ